MESTINIIGVYFAGIVTGMVLFRYAFGYSTKLISQIKVDKIVEQLGNPTEQDFTGDEE